MSLSCFYVYLSCSLKLFKPLHWIFSKDLVVSQSIDFVFGEVNLVTLRMRLS